MGDGEGQVRCVCWDCPTTNEDMPRTQQDYPCLCNTDPCSQAAWCPLSMAVQPLSGGMQGYEVSHT